MVMSNRISAKDMNPIGKPYNLFYCISYFISLVTRVEIKKM